MEEIDTWYQGKRTEHQRKLYNRKSEPVILINGYYRNNNDAEFSDCSVQRYVQRCNSNKEWSSDGNYSPSLQSCRWRGPSPIGINLRLLNRPNMKKSSDSTSKHHAVLKNKSPLLPKKSAESIRSGSDGDKTYSAEETDNQTPDILSVPSVTSNGGSVEQLLSIEDEDTSALTSGPLRTKEAIKTLQHKINKTKQSIKSEQTAKEESVNEYLRLAGQCDKQQLLRIKTAFEKKNQKSAQTIQTLQKKLENYNKRLKDVEQFGVTGHRQPKEVLRDMGHGLKGVGANIRDGISGLSGGVVGNIKGATEMIVSKPREFAHLVKNRFGSADNIAQLSKSTVDDAQEVRSEKDHPSGGSTLPAKLRDVLDGHDNSHSFKVYCSEDDALSDISGSGVHASPKNVASISESRNHLSSPMDSPEAMEKLREFEGVLLTLSQNQAQLKESLDTLKSNVRQIQDDLATNRTMIEDMKLHITQIEDQQNDWTELHSNELANVKQEIASMEEKIEYQLEERTSDMHDLLENCQTRITKMELQQQQQQVISMEGVENATARVLITKLINVVLAVLAVLLVFVSTIARCLGPFMTSKTRFLSLFVLIISGMIAFHHWPTIGHSLSFLTEKLRSISWKSPND